ncbi:DUF3466 family protein [Vibrio sp. D404a]|uniref:DUF3466 family protein n=1 Tax=unclassified Vibrio TaxID=2614977 RepID=UPI0025559EB1|nr:MULTISPECIES: DUF3466 family protein [unclassified Vibrio]MDK9735789.1 DUF3466 family protein [Vibrio sp. D404a]MDK9796653.1 DUF3466 family protein [Vibrio sp. D449a]
MSSTNFKLTTIAALVLAATNANAALYQVVEVEKPAAIANATETFGVAIQPGSATDGSNELAMGCFDSNATNCATDSFKLAGETRNTVEGVSYREEVPFAMDAAFQYIQEFDDFENYCYRELKYSTCESWALQRWKTWELEINDLTHVNTQAFVEGGTSSISTYNVVINALDNAAAPLGIESNGNDIRNNAVTTVPVVAASESRAWGAKTLSDGTVVNYGSISVDQPNTGTSTITFSSKAAIWDDKNNTQQLDWILSDVPQNGDYFAQGSMRGLVEKSGKLYGVGFNTRKGSGDLQDMNASVFISDGIDLATAQWTTTDIDGARVNSGSSNDDALYSNSVVADINDNLLAVGYAKRNGYVPESGSAANKAFVVDNIASGSPSANFTLQSSLFFTGAGSEAKALNNFNEFVGQVDADTIREVDGSERRHRGFIYPYQATGTDASRIALFDSKAWWLDDLTNGANADGQDFSDQNNFFRIIDASDINDAGVISATAIKCTVNGVPQQYDTTSHNSYCGNASSDAVEQVVAVKLVPISGATSDDIKERGTDSQNVERQGAGLGVFALTLLGFLGFRRKFK